MAYEARKRLFDTQSVILAQQAEAEAIQIDLQREHASQKIQQKTEAENHAG